MTYRSFPTRLDETNAEDKNEIQKLKRLNKEMKESSQPNETKMELERISKGVVSRMVISTSSTSKSSNAVEHKVRKRKMAKKDVFGEMEMIVEEKRNDVMSEDEETNNCEKNDQDGMEEGTQNAIECDEGYDLRNGACYKCGASENNHCLICILLLM